MEGEVFCSLPSVWTSFHMVRISVTQDGEPHGSPTVPPEGPHSFSVLSIILDTCYHLCASHLMVTEWLLLSHIRKKGGALGKAQPPVHFPFRKQNFHWAHGADPLSEPRPVTALFPDRAVLFSVAPRQGQGQLGQGTSNDLEKRAKKGRLGEVASEEPFTASHSNLMSYVPHTKT